MARLLPISEVMTLFGLTEKGLKSLCKRSEIQLNGFSGILMLDPTMIETAMTREIAKQRARNEVRGLQATQRIDRENLLQDYAVKAFQRLKDFGFGPGDKVPEGTLDIEMSRDTFEACAEYVQAKRVTALREQADKVSKALNIANSLRVNRRIMEGLGSEVIEMDGEVRA